MEGRPARRIGGQRLQIGQIGKGGELGIRLRPLDHRDDVVEIGDGGKDLRPAGKADQIMDQGGGEDGLAGAAEAGDGEPQGALIDPVENLVDRPFRALSTPAQDIVENPGRPHGGHRGRSPEERRRSRGSCKRI